MALNIQLPQLNLDLPRYNKEFLANKLEAFKQTIEDPSYGFFHIINDQDLISQCQEIYQHHKQRVKTFVQVGIGGSSLGPEMLTSAINTTGVSFIYINNIDPDHLYEQLNQITDIEETLFYFVSKSGGTAETMSSFAIITNWLADKGISKLDLPKYFIFGTDPVKSDMLTLGNELKVSCVSVPSNVGGRFSVLTPVGYLPALFAGISLEKLIAGAKETAQAILNNPVDENPLLLICSYLDELKEKGVNQTVFMPYSSKLRNLSFWFVQLWAESLGKEYSLDKKTVHQGLTPVPAYGATDQHSQMQLFMAGPYDKVLFMLEVENFEHDYSLENKFETPSLKKLSHYTLSQLMQAEFQGTLTALSEAGRPYIHFKINKNNEHNLGALILFFESLTAMMGHYLNINPFDQPGVEAGKKYAFEWLARKR